MKTVFLRVLEADDKAVALLDAVRNPEQAAGKQRFELSPKSFSSVPHSPFAYWISERIRALFVDLPAMENSDRTIKVGVQTFDDPRFLLLSWEPSPRTRDHSKWFPFAKGGKHSRFYSDIHLLVNFSYAGKEISAFKYAHRPREGRQHRALEYYGRPGLTWPRRTQAFGVRMMPPGCIFGDKGPAAFFVGDLQESILAHLAILSSKVFDSLVAVSLNAADATARSYEVGVIQRTPIPQISAADQSTLAKLSHRAWSLKLSVDTRTETSHAFTIPALLHCDGDIAFRRSAWLEQVRAVEAELSIIESEIDDRCFALYGVDEADRHTITDGFGRSEEPQVGDAGEDEKEELLEDTDKNDSAFDAATLAAELVSWSVGLTFGRFDIRLATGERPMPKPLEPFDPLPFCSPGMLTGNDGLPLPTPPEGYPLSFPDNGIQVDDLGQVSDLTTAVHAVFDVAFGEDGDRWWNDVAATLDPKGHELRDWLAGSFFEYHLKRYSKSRRKAPILWQFGTQSGRYSVWLYAHRISSDSFFQLQNDVVGPKLNHEERQLTNLTQSAGDSPSVAERKAIAAQETLVQELRAMLEQIKRVAPLWNPNLDDGVALTMAPLWRLVPQHKPWQQELKGKWNELVDGKYDWAHLAMHLWPERVVPKCTIDRSVAIAHGLEDLFWLEDFNNQWRVVEKPAQEREHVASYWACSPRTKLLAQARDLWTERYFNAGRIDSDWWHEVERGEHDDHPLAIRLWARRVCEAALVNPAIAEAHELNLPKPAAFSAEEANQRIEAWLDKMSTRHGAAEIDRSFTSAAFAVPDTAREWKAWWSQLDDGQLDHLPLARHFRPEEVAKACQSTLELAEAHEVRRFFFIDTGSGLRKRMSPAEEILREVAERTSPAVKAALKSLIEAPCMVTSKQSSRARSRR